MLAAGVVLSGAAGNSLLSVGLRSADLVNFSPLAHLKALANIAVITGISALICRYIFQLALLSWTDLTFALPITSTSFVLITIVGVFALGEHVSPAHWLGILFIIAGVIVVGRTRPLTTAGDGKR